MYGFPWDSEITVKKMEDFIRKYPVSSIMLVRPMKGTPLYGEYKNSGLIEKDLTLDDYVFCRKYPVYPTLYLTREELYKWHRRFEAITSRYSFERKIKEDGFVMAIIDLIKIKGFRLINPKKIFDHLFYD